MGRVEQKTIQPFVLVKLSTIVVETVIRKSFSTIGVVIEKRDGAESTIILHNIMNDGEGMILGEKKLNVVIRTGHHGEPFVEVVNAPVISFHMNYAGGVVESRL